MQELNDAEREAGELSVALFEELEALRASHREAESRDDDAHEALMRSQNQLATIQAATNLDLVCTVLLEWAMASKRRAFSSFRSRFHYGLLEEAEAKLTEANHQAESLAEELVENNALLVELSAVEEIRTSEVVARESEMGRLLSALEEQEARFKALGEASGDEQITLLTAQLQEATTTCRQLEQQLDEAQARVTLYDKLQPLSSPKSPGRSRSRAASTARARGASLALGEDHDPFLSPPD